MANGNKNGDGNGNGIENQEIVVSSIRAGMKREFAMMMKAQAECGIIMGQRRVTRSQNSPLINKAEGIIGKNFMCKKKKKDDKHDVAEEGINEVEEVVDTGMLGGNGEMVRLVVKEEEEKLGRDGVEEMMVIREKQGSEVEKIVSEDVAKEEVLMKELKDGIGELMNEELVEIGKEKRVELDSGCGAVGVLRMVEGKSGGQDAVPASNVGATVFTSVNRAPQKTYFRRFKRSALKVEAVEQPKVEPVEQPTVEVMETVEQQPKVGAVEQSKMEEVVETVEQQPEVEVVEQSKMEEVVVTVEQQPEVEAVEQLKMEAVEQPTVEVMEAVEQPTVGVMEAMEQQPKVEAVEHSKMVAVEQPTAEIMEAVVQLPKLEAVEQQKVEEAEQSRSEVVKDEEAVDSSSLVSVPTSSKLEMKMSKKVELKKLPTKLKELLETGFLEGLPVSYVRGSRASKTGEAGLHGIIKGSGILCFCDGCKGTQVVTPNQFELHAGSGNKRPPEYIYLENGKCLRDILNVCKDTSSDSLELVIRNAVGRSHAIPTFCLNCKGYIPQAGLGGPLLCDSCVTLRESEKNTAQSTDTSSRPSLPLSGSKSSGKMSSSSRPKNKGQGRLTKKDLRLHKLVFESSFIADGTPLGYYAQGKQLRSGYKLGAGIFCYCCNQVVSPSLFEAHAGCASRRKPYLQIYTPDGVSLHEWCLAIKRNLQSSTDESDDICSICEGMGELLCCDMCPRAFHKECINLPSIPEGDWYCRYCVSMIQKEKFVERNANAVAAGRVAGIDPVEEVKKRCVRIVGASEPEVGGCVLCRGHDFSKSDFGPLTVILCDQCEKEYHVGCLKEHGMDDLKELPEETWFCCRECSSIHSALQQIVNDGEKKLPDFLLSLIKQKHEDQGSGDNSDLNISWRLLHGKMASEESRKWLSGAVSVFHDRFDPIGDSIRSQHDLIPIMIYGRSNGDQDFGGMYCAILTVNSIVVSAGVFRIFGQEVAEIPLVATSNSCQGKGYFQSLFFCIENLLASVNVRELVLPAAQEAEAIWMNKFGFVKISTEQLKQYRKDYQMMIFQGTSVLHKTVVNLDVSKS